MAMSLEGYAEVLHEVVVLSDDELEKYSTELKAVEQFANDKTKGGIIGRQATESARLLLHISFEESQRAGVPAADFAKSVKDGVQTDTPTNQEVVLADVSAA